MTRVLNPIAFAAALATVLGPRLLVASEDRDKATSRVSLANVRDPTEDELDLYRAKRAELDAGRRRAMQDTAPPPAWDHARPPVDGARARARRLRQLERIAAKRA